jgi:hypothetical protein
MNLKMELKNEWSYKKLMRTENIDLTPVWIIFSVIFNEIQQKGIMTLCRVASFATEGYFWTAAQCDMPNRNSRLLLHSSTMRYAEPQRTRLQNMCRPTPDWSTPFHFCLLFMQNDSPPQSPAQGAYFPGVKRPESTVDLSSAPGAKVSSAVTWSQGLPTSCNEMVLGYSAI